MTVWRACFRIGWHGTQSGAAPSSSVCGLLPHEAQPLHPHCSRRATNGITVWELTWQPALLHAEAARPRPVQMQAWGAIQLFLQAAQRANAPAEGIEHAPCARLPCSTWRWGQRAHAHAGGSPTFCMRAARMSDAAVRTNKHPPCERGVPTFCLQAWSPSPAHTRAGRAGPSQVGCASSCPHGPGGPPPGSPPSHHRCARCSSAAEAAAPADPACGAASSSKRHGSGSVKSNNSYGSGCCPSWPCTCALKLAAA